MNGPCSSSLTFPSTPQCPSFRSPPYPPSLIALLPPAPLHSPPRYYADTENLLVYAGTKNYLGDHKLFQGNVIVHPDAGLTGTPYCHHECSTWFADSPSPVPGGTPWGEQWSNNTCVMQTRGGGDQGITGASPVHFQLDPKHLSATVPILGNNTYYLPGGVNEYVPSELSTQMTLKELQGKGYEGGSVVHATAPSVEEILALGRAVLGMK